MAIDARLQGAGCMVGDVKRRMQSGRKICVNLWNLCASIMSFCFIILFIFKGISEPAKAGLP